VIELSKLAQNLGVSMRAMQLGFQRYFGYSPRDSSSNAVWSARIKTCFQAVSRIR